ncbi:hypothetical protein EV121DRAFT_271246 [Schizophyllum commune]
MSDTSTLRYSSDEQSPDRADYSYSYPPEYGFSRADGRAKARPLSRRLPPTPRPRPASVRPLPSIPHYMTCKRCRSCVTTEGSALSPSALPPTARPFKGYAGKAALYTQMFNVRVSQPVVQLMVTGAHTMQEVMCRHCNAYLGWYIVRAHEETEKWKEGCFLVELEHVALKAQTTHSAGSASSDDSS